jgi:glycosyltransferase involved in cell wall biosynthesis
MQDALQTYHTGKVSIIIPVYNRELLLPETLDSILAQTYINWECILVDDGSTDDSLSVCNSYAQQDVRFKVFSRPASIRKGANGCRNFGFQQSDGEFIQWFDSDDLMEKDLIVSALEQIGIENDMVFSGAAYFDIDKREMHEKPFHFGDFNRNLIVDILSGYCHIGTPQAFFKKAFLDFSREQFNEKLNRNQETEFFIRLLLRHPSISINQKTTVYIRNHKYSISGNYVQLTDGEKLLVNFPAYLLIYSASKKSNELSPELLSLFKDYFYRCLRKMPSKSIEYVELYFRGILNSWFPSPIMASKIFLSRLVNYA